VRKFRFHNTRVDIEIEAEDAYDAWQKWGKENPKEAVHTVICTDITEENSE
jgi:hypothetical protein